MFKYMKIEYAVDYAISFHDIININDLNVYNILCMKNKMKIFQIIVLHTQNFVRCLVFTRYFYRADGYISKYDSPK